jgi:hypothetical protein
MVGEIGVVAKLLVDEPPPTHVRRVSRVVVDLVAIVGHAEGKAGAPSFRGPVGHHRVGRRRTTSRRFAREFGWIGWIARSGRLAEG